MTEGSRKVDDPQLKDLDHSEHTNKLEGDQDQGITAEKKDDLKRNSEKKGTMASGFCGRCGKIGHCSEECLKPILCGRCKQEGHMARACEEVLPWECIAPFVGLASPSQGFHVIQNEGLEETNREMANCALIIITKGLVTARQIENEFKAQSGSQSTWRWFAKRISENIFQMRFPTAKKMEVLSFFTDMQMGTAPDVTFKVEQWNANVGAKVMLETTWFRIFDIPMEKRYVQRACIIASLVGLPLEVNSQNPKRWDL